MPNEPSLPAFLVHSLEQAHERTVLSPRVFFKGADHEPLNCFANKPAVRFASSLVVCVDPRPNPQSDWDRTFWRARALALDFILTLPAVLHSNSDPCCRIDPQSKNRAAKRCEGLERPPKY